MKVLIVEDEIKTLNGIAGLIEEIGCGFEIAGRAKCAEEGIPLILERKPDIVITDIRMSKMNGLDMIRKLNESKYQGRYIILSGYAEFQYAREALALGSMDYLLKPITRELLERTLRKVREAIEEEAQKIRPADMRTEQLLERALYMPGYMESEFEQELERRFAEKHRMYLLLIRGENRIVSKDLSGIIKEVEKSFAGVPFYVCRNSESRETYILFTEKAEETEARLDRICRRCRATINAFVVFAGCGLENIAALKNGRERVIDAVQWNLSLHEPMLLTEERIAALEPKHFQYPSELEHMIVNGINEGKIAGMEEHLKAFSHYLVHETYACADIREAMVCITAAVLYAIRRASYGLYENISNLNILEWVGNSLFLENFVQMLVNILQQYEKYTQNLRTGNHPIINKVLKIMEGEYKNELTLEEMAERMDVTPEYLSGLFMKELGIKYTTYRAQIRIDAAKRLLQKGKLKIYEVAEESGFTDVRYFTKVFKKYTGVSPGEYVRTVVRG